MRTKIAIGGLIAALALTLASSAYAMPAHKERPKVFFGEFVASRAEGPITKENPATVKGHGEAEFSVGPWTWECEKLKSTGAMEAERSETFWTAIKFSGCSGTRTLAKGITEHVKFKMGAGTVMEFKANGSGQFGENSGELRVKKGSTIIAKAKGGACKIELPQQYIPVKAEVKPEHEFEAVTYSNEPPEPTAKKNIYPTGFKQRLEIEWETAHFLYYIPADNGSGCEFSESAGNYNKEMHRVELKGSFEGFLEELEIKNGEFEFSTTEA